MQAFDTSHPRDKTRVSMVERTENCFLLRITIIIIIGLSRWRRKLNKLTETKAGVEDVDCSRHVRARYACDLT